MHNECQGTRGSISNLIQQRLAIHLSTNSSGNKFTRSRRIRMSQFGMFCCLYQLLFDIIHIFRDQLRRFAKKARKERENGKKVLIVGGHSVRFSNLIRTEFEIRHAEVVGALKLSA